MLNITIFNLNNLDLFAVGLAVCAILILGFAIFFNDTKNNINKTFLLMCVSASIWSILNYVTYQPDKPEIVIWLLRSAIFFAVLFSFFIFKLLYVFPHLNQGFEKAYKYFILPLTLATLAMNLTPLVFKKISALDEMGRVVEVENGPGIALFGICVVLLISLGTVLLTKKWKASQPKERKQITPVISGILLSSALLIIFNFIFPAFLNNPKYIIFGGVFLFPFVALTSYAIFQYKLFSVKIIATEILTFFLAVGILFEIILASEPLIVLFRFFLFLLVLALGILLIKSVRKEVRQREQLEALTKELELVNEKLKALDLARAEFITIASHQLRTPPATIKWYLSAVLAGDYGTFSEETKEALEKTQRANNGLISLIDDMLNVSRIERGKMEFLFQPVDVEILAREVFEQLLPIARQKNLELIYNQPTSPLPKLMADREKIKQVMNNMLDNGLKYTKQGRVEIWLSQEGNNIRFEVKDTGKGFDQEEQKAIFTKYMRGKSAESHGAGLGLGMYVGQAIIGQHQGRIWAESKGVGKGSSFIFTLPINNNLKATTLLDLSIPGRVEPS